MSLLHYRPASPLNRYVECFWWSHRDMPQTYEENMLPSGRAQLVIPLHAAPLRYRRGDAAAAVSWTGGLVHGPQRQFYVGGTKPSGAVIGVSFRAGCAGAVLGVESSELVDRHVPLCDLWGKRASVLQEQLLTCADPPAAFQILERHLGACIRARLLMHPAIAHALTSAWLPARIAQLQQTAGYSPKHFIALFSSAVGITPKHYYRIQRFNEVARRIAGGGSTLADIAATSGYSDQAHLTREFRELAGVTPSRYQGHDDSPLHHPLSDACGGPPRR
jgi:AraC-like DNA-binding protein